MNKTRMVPFRLDASQQPFSEKALRVVLSSKKVDQRKVQP